MHMEVWQLQLVLLCLVAAAAEDPYILKGVGRCSDGSTVSPTNESAGESAWRTSEVGSDKRCLEVEELCAADPECTGYVSDESEGACALVTTKDINTTDGEADFRCFVKRVETSDQRIQGNGWLLSTIILGSACCICCCGSVLDYYQEYQIRSNFSKFWENYTRFKTKAAEGRDAESDQNFEKHEKMVANRLNRKLTLAMSILIALKHIITGVVKLAGLELKLFLSVLFLARALAKEQVAAVLGAIEEVKLLGVQGLHVVGEWINKMFASLLIWEDLDVDGCKSGNQAVRMTILFMGIAFFLKKFQFNDYYFRMQAFNARLEQAEGFVGTFVLPILEPLPELLYRLIFLFFLFLSELIGLLVQETKAAIDGDLSAWGSRCIQTWDEYACFAFVFLTVLMLVIFGFIILPTQLTTMNPYEAVLLSASSSLKEAAQKNGHQLPGHASNICTGLTRYMLASCGIWTVAVETSYAIRWRAHKYAMGDHILAMQSTIRIASLPFSLIPTFGVFITVLAAALNECPIYTHSGIEVPAEFDCGPTEETTTTIEVEGTCKQTLVRKIKWLFAVGSVLSGALLAWLPSELTATIAVLSVIPVWLLQEFGEFAALASGYASRKLRALHKMAKFLGVDIERPMAKAKVIAMDNRDWVEGAAGALNDAKGERDALKEFDKEAEPDQEATPEPTHKEKTTAKTSKDKVAEKKPADVPPGAV